MSRFIHFETFHLQTDPVNTDYVLEAGATRNFEALRTAELQAVREQKEKEDEEANNPMKVIRAGLIVFCSWARAGNEHRITCDVGPACYTFV